MDTTFSNKGFFNNLANLQKQNNDEEEVADDRTIQPSSTSQATHLLTTTTTSDIEVAEYHNKQVLKRMLQANSIRFEEEEVGAATEAPTTTSPHSSSLLPAQNIENEENKVEEEEESEGEEDGEDGDGERRKGRRGEGDAELGFYYDSDDSGGKGPGTVSIAGMTKEQKKAHKAKVKEENREKRKNKMSKFDKKKAMNKGKHKK